MANKSIRVLMKKEKIYMWQIAEIIGVHETTLIKYFRKELTKEYEEQVLNAIRSIQKQRLSEQE